LFYVCMYTTKIIKHNKWLSSLYMSPYRFGSFSFVWVFVSISTQDFMFPSFLVHWGFG